MKEILLLTPPFTQLNTPYPGTAYVKGFLNTKKISSYQMDLGIEVILEIFSKKGLENVFEYAEKVQSFSTNNAKRIFALQEEYISNIDPIIRFLQGGNQTLARRICTENYLPQASKFDQVDELEWAFGTMGMQDKAKHLATLFIEDVSDFITEAVDSNFGFSRYAERLGMSANSFDELSDSLNEKLSYVDEIALKIIDRKIKTYHPKLVGMSVPFPGNLYSGFRIAQYIKQEFPEIKIAMGGGFPNTELRSLSDPRVFEFFDYISLDDGELPIELIHKQITQGTKELKRTYLCKNGRVEYINNSTRPDYKQSQVGTPDYSDLLLDKYISVIEIANPMHSLWSDGRWNKLTMAHGCYWGKCTFCDISLDYIKLYEPSTAKLLVDRMEEMIAQTGETGFHFVDEAAPPALMKALAIEIIKRDLKVSWWTNIRFEKSFTYDLCYLLLESGCIGVSGGLEVASDRLLDLIQKGVSVEQVAQVTANFTDVGILVHSYLMYGYPTQTVQETVDSLEMVRQLFELGVLNSGFWHQFALTTHSPIGHDPKAYGITPKHEEITFANNDIQFTDSTGIDHNKFSFGLKKSLLNYMHGIGFEMNLQEWFDFKIPKTKIPANYINKALELNQRPLAKANSKIVWLGVLPEIKAKKSKKNKDKSNNSFLYFNSKNDSFKIELESKKAQWLKSKLAELRITSKASLSYSDLKLDFESKMDSESFDLFWYTDEMEVLRGVGLVVL